ncbi:MAG TPA: hypothetical protein VFA10_04715 [Ktedonobacteraceae bacterium]|nr:hypothetical protein [Ktedonobacteraceae bacterium]
MHVSSGEPSVVHRFALRLYLIMISVILLLIVVEGALIGPSLFIATHFGRTIHGDLGGLLLLLALLVPVVSGLSRLPGRMTLPGVVLFALTLIQAMSAALGRRFLVLAALHPANALLMAALAMLLLMRAWQMMRQRSDEVKTSAGPPS